MGKAKRGKNSPTIGKGGVADMPYENPSYSQEPEIVTSKGELYCRRGTLEDEELEYFDRSGDVHGSGYELLEHLLTQLPQRTKTFLPVLRVRWELMLISLTSSSGDSSYESQSE